LIVCAELLYLHHNRFTGTIPTQFDLLTRLREFIGRRVRLSVFLLPSALMNILLVCFSVSQRNRGSMRISLQAPTLVQTILVLAWSPVTTPTTRFVAPSPSDRDSKQHVELGDNSCKLNSLILWCLVVQSGYYNSNGSWRVDYKSSLTRHSRKLTERLASGIELWKLYFQIRARCALT
jgi:hypothetical protein